MRLLIITSSPSNADIMTSTQTTTINASNSHPILILYGSWRVYYFCVCVDGMHVLVHQIDSNTDSDSRSSELEQECATTGP